MMGWPVATGRILTVSLAAYLAAGVSFAEAATDEEAILARLEQLEQRITELESELASSRAEIRAARSQSTTTEFAVSSTTAATSSATTASAAGTRAVPGSGQPVVESSNTDDRRLGQEVFINRDTVPTLSARSFEFSQEFSYGRNANFIQSERSLSSVTNLRYGLQNGLEIGLRLPAFYSRRVTTIAASGSVSSLVVTGNGGLGDAELSFSYLALEQRRNRPGMSLSVSLITPTGANPYFFPAAYTAGSLPFDGTIGFQSHSHWGARVGAQFFKNADPLVLFWGGNVEYLLDKQVAGHNIRRGLRVGANVGFSLALSTHTTVANSLQFNYEGAMAVDGVTVTGTNSETLTNRLVLIQRVGENSYVEPSVTIGLTDNAGDVQLGFGYRKRW